MSYWHLASNKPILISPAERSIFWNVFLCWLHNLIQEAHKFHSKPFSLTESHPTFFFLKKHSFVSLSSNLVLFCQKNLCISFFPALSTMSKMSYDMQLFWHRSFSWGGKPLKKKWQLDFIWTLLNIFSVRWFLPANIL